MNSPRYLRRKAACERVRQLGRSLHPSWFADVGGEIHNLNLYEHGKDVLELCLGPAQIWGSRPRGSRLKGEAEMLRKLPTVVPIAVLLAAVSAAPALANTRRSARRSAGFEQLV
jgi:hypothetical protein